MKKLSNFYRVSQVNEEELKNRLRQLKLVKLADGRYDVIGDADFSRLGLTNLLEIPIKIRKVTGDFDCSDNYLRDLEGAPKVVGKSFYCHNNQLTTLKGAPEYVGDSFYCSYNNLKDLKGAPKYVGKSFSCGYNQLETLEGAPERIGEDFYCSGNQLASLKGIPKYIGGAFICRENPVQFTIEEVRKVADVKGLVMV